jgi:methylase of polypeptide subunit release factors
MQTGRKEFLRLMAAAAALRPVAANASPQQTATTGEGNQQPPFPQRVVEDYAAALGCALCYIGDRLGLFKTMAQSGPVTAADLARKSDLNARMLREWLNGMVAARYLEYRPADKTYLLPKDHAYVLADEESSPMFRGGLFQFLMAVYSAAPQVARMIQTGKPAEFPAEGALAGERSFAPSYRHELVQKWIPLLPGVQEKLSAGARALDFACGAGVASVVLAKAFPKSEFVGYDLYAPSIRRARERARKEGVSDRVQFVAADATKLPRERFDLITIFNSMHHF